MIYTKQLVSGHASGEAPPIMQPMVVEDHRPNKITATFADRNPESSASKAVSRPPRILIGPMIKDPYLDLLNGYAEAQQKMKEEVEKLPWAFQQEVYARISLAYGSVKNVTLGQQKLIRDLTLLNKVLIDVTNDVSHAYIFLRSVGGSCYGFSKQTVAQIQKLVISKEITTREAVSVLFKDFDPTIEQMDEEDKVMVGPSIRQPYLALLEAYRAAQQQMRDNIARLPEPFQLEVYERLSVRGGYSRVGDAQIGKLKLVKNLSLLNEILIQVTKDVSTANQLLAARPNQDTREIWRRFSDEAHVRIAFSMTSIDLRQAVQRAFFGFDPC